MMPVKTHVKTWRFLRPQLGFLRWVSGLQGENKLGDSVATICSVPSGKDDRVLSYGLFGVCGERAL